MKRRMSTEKYGYILENERFFVSCLTEQIRQDTPPYIPLEDMLDFLTTPIIYEDGYQDNVLYRNYVEFIQMVEELKKYYVLKEKGSKDPTLHFFYQLIGAIDPEDPMRTEKIKILLEYVRYHISVTYKLKQKRKAVSHGRNHQ